MGLGSSWSVRKMTEPQPRKNSGLPPKPLSIRVFNFSSDFETVIDLWGHAGDGIHLRRSDEPDEILKKLERDPDLFLVAEIEGRIVGAVLGGFDGRRGMMYHLAVAQAHRHYGIAAALMSELETKLRAKGCIRYYLLVTQDNDEAIQFYEARGWDRMPLYAYGKDLD
jgi:ribosomal protein S18 acetylase RimI-like enzyme